MKKVDADKKAERLERYEEVREAVEAFRQAAGIRDGYLRNCHQFPKVKRQTSFDEVDVQVRPFRRGRDDEYNRRIKQVFGGMEERLSTYLAARGFACFYDYPDGLTFWVVRESEEVAPWILRQVLDGRMKLRARTPSPITDALIAARLASDTAEG